MNLVTKIAILSMIQHFFTIIYLSFIIRTNDHVQLFLQLTQAINAPQCVT